MYIQTDLKSKIGKFTENQEFFYQKMKITIILQNEDQPYTDVSNNLALVKARINRYLNVLGLRNMWDKYFLSCSYFYEGQKFPLGFTGFISRKMMPMHIADLLKYDLRPNSVLQISVSSVGDTIFQDQFMALKSKKPNKSREAFGHKHQTMLMLLNLYTNLGFVNFV